MRRFKGRAAKACHYCHTQKVKCSGERPCTRCQASHRDCIFPSKDRLVTVPQNYVRTLQNEIHQLRQLQAERGPIPGDAERQSLYDSNPERLIENSTTEYFVSKLKGACTATEPAQYQENAIPETPESTSRSGLSHSHHAQHSSSNYTYVPLDYESNARVAVKLPPYSYAVYLLNQFEAFIGSDYHWYHRRHFHEKIEATYNSPHKQSADKAWLCCFSVVLALGESYTCRVTPSFIVEETTASNTNTKDAGQVVAPPGIELFKQGLLLLKPSYEEPTLEQIEALNLIVFYSYSLNRRRTAYAYAGTALRLAKIMGLSSTPDPRNNIEPVEAEHRKRVWWTTICMDLMTCTELSIAPTDGFDDDRIGFPDSSSLSLMDAGEAFSDPQYLTAQVKLHRIKYRIIERISKLRSGDADETRRLLAPCLEALRAWRLEFPASLEYAEDGGFAESTLARPEMRTIASILMRYNQCYILLLRPLLLKQLSSLVKEVPLASSSSDLVSLNAECLCAARDNSLIQIALHKCHKIAKFGFWESLHIFSSLTIRIISNFILDKSPTSFPSTETKSSYQAVRDLLGEMAQVGNLASRDHEQMIRDVEELFETGPPGSTGPTTDDIGDFAAWGDLFDFGNTGFDTAIFDSFPSSLEHF